VTSNQNETKEDNGIIVFSSTIPSFFF